MRRAQTVRHYATRSSTMPPPDDHGTIRESSREVEETIEDVLRQQLLEKTKENDKLRSQIQTLQSQLHLRPPLEAVQELNKERTNLEILLEGTQRENAKTMAELEQVKSRTKELEANLEKLLGPNWQDNLGISAPPNALPGMSSALKRPRAESVPPVPATPASATTSRPANSDATLAHFEQIRLLIVGMEQRLQTREEKLVKSMEKAETESAKFEELHKQISSSNL